MKKLKKFILFSVIGIVLIIFTILGIEAIFLRHTSEDIYSDISKIPPRETVIVLGASVHSDGKLSPILKDRVDTAIKLYRSNKVKNFHVTGDHRTEDYNEIAAMVSYLRERGIPQNRITSDHAGLDTYDSMYRAGKLFNIENATVVTQEFHLPRALFISDQLGFNYFGFTADQRTYQTEYRLKQREKLANVKALWEVLINKEPSTMEYRLDSSED
ncbi:ElyC/SanA/YdcF family protein [uncultured Christiangramia sp.]|uniref:SanA/YdcF family protein n=1 Tax=uncultured Christiangramia sp. TaxID=503836 RepID=UPI0025EFC936|nr:ElyC/SanA/YdcF family protein [uncultured Christiangramia sp.]|tara:strand:- start:739 stop:1383 length:645 start_codon:yes stop_codon:yes gene_type:complete